MTAENNAALNPDQKWMDYAQRLAAKAEALGEVPVGAVLVKDGEVLGEGFNQPISSHDPSAHAEIVALRAAAEKLQNYRLVGATLYVTLEPCTMCVGAIVHSRIARLVYGAAEPKAGAVKSASNLLNAAWFNHQIEVTGGVQAEACGQQLSDFFAARRKAKKAAKAQQDGPQSVSGKSSFV